MRTCWIALAVACGGSHKPSADANLLAELDGELAHRPDDAQLLFQRASLSAQAGDLRTALAYIARVDAAGWNVPFAATDFASLERDPAYAAAAARVAARSPRVARSSLAFSVAPDLSSEGITVGPDGTFYVGSMRRRTILAVDAAGTARPFVAPRRDGLMAVLGMKVDAARGLLWATSYASETMDGYTAADRTAGGLYAFALGDGAPRRRVAFAPGTAQHLLNDLAIDGDGTLYVTDTLAGAVFRVPPDRDALEPLLPPDTVNYPNGIALVEGRLFVAHVTGIAIVDPRTGARRALEPAPGVWLGGIDGLLFDGTQLVAVQNGLGQPRLVAIALSPERDRATALTVLENDAGMLEMPTTSCIWGGALYTLADPRIVKTPL